MAGWVAETYGVSISCAFVHVKHSDSHRLMFSSVHAFANTTPQVHHTFTAGASASNFKLSVLASEHPSYISLEEQFLSKWLKNTNGLTVKRVIKVEVRNA